MNFTPYLHSCNCGDLIGALAGIRQIYRNDGKKATIYQELDIPGQYYAGAIHSVKDDKGIQVTMNQKMFDMMRPLLLAQEYVEDFQVYTDQQPFIPLTIIRGKINVNIPYGALPSWTMLAFPDMACDLSEPWISLPPRKHRLFPDMILINRTQRYQNNKINYSFLKKYEADLVFTGTETEHRNFCKDFGLDICRLEVDNFLELALAMQECMFFVGNQSFPWNLANAMGAPRILEMCAFAPNCQPFVGKHNYGFLHQKGLEYYFDLLHKKKAANTAASEIRS